MCFSQFLSLDSPKAIKARKLGWLNGINYMAPSDLAGVGNVCPDASAGCLALCLGWFSGQAGMVTGNTRRGSNSVRASRIAKVKLFMHDRPAFMAEARRGIERAQRAATKLQLRLCVRMNGATDIPWESIGQSPVDRRSIFTLFPDTQFVDYTKSLKRMLRFLEGKFPPNYHLTFSRSETNESACQQVLALGGTVAVVFAGEFPSTYLGYPVIDGDISDLRHLDPASCIIGLSPKGPKASRDRSGFVVRSPT